MPISSVRKKKRKTLKQQHPQKKPNNLEVNKTHNRDVGSVSQSYYQGIVPSPEMMEKYKQVSESLPDRLVKLTEDEAIHRRKIEKRITGYHFASQLIGQVFALTAVGMVCYLSYSFMKNGNASEGKAIAISVIIGVATLFLGKRIFFNNKEKTPV